MENNSKLDSYLKGWVDGAAKMQPLDRLASDHDYAEGAKDGIRAMQEAATKAAKRYGVLGQSPPTD